jgi:Cu(I)/Ag(I) efflux system membrane fusion protein
MTTLLARFAALLAILAFTATSAAILSAEEPLPPLPGTGQESPSAPELWGELPPLPDLHEDADDEQKTIWTCSMHPNIQLPEFGQCPICFMDLIEVPLDSDAKLTNLRQLTLTANARKLAQVEVTPAVRRDAPTSVPMVGKVNYDETLVSSITAWINGRIDKLHVDYTGAQVRAGQPMAEIYSPELLAAQAELIEAVAAAAKINGSDNPLLRQTINRTQSAARKKLQLLGLTDKQISDVVNLKSTS